MYNAFSYPGILEQFLSHMMSIGENAYYHRSIAEVNSSSQLSADYHLFILTLIDYNFHAFCIHRQMCDAKPGEEEILILCVDSSTTKLCCLIITRTITHMTKISIPSFLTLHIYSLVTRKHVHQLRESVAG